MPESLANSSTIPELRRNILRDAGTDCPELDIHTFLHNFLPRVPKLDNVQVDAIVRHIKQRTRGYTRGRWTAFAENPPLSSDDEDTIFRGFDKVVATIQKAAEHCVSGLEPKTKYISLFQASTSTSDLSQQNTNRPNGCFVFLNDRLRYGAVPHWMDISVAGEFKKYQTDRHIYDNVEKALWNMHHTLHDDPCRRFAFAFTIEDVNMRVWFCNRAEIVVSEPFNFVAEIKPLVQFVLAFVYAPEVAMGIDESMTAIWDGQETAVPQYLVTVRSAEHPHVIKQYQTIRLISAVGAESIRCRGTRMWEVKEVKNGKMVGKSMVLKDSWIDSDRPCEAAVIEKIFDDAKRFENPEDRDLLQQSLPEPVIAGDVWIGDDVDITIWGKVRTFDSLPRFNLVRPPVTYHTDSSADTESTPPPDGPSVTTARARRGETHHIEATQKPVAACRSKTHYRVVFSEVCEVLHEIDSLPDILYTLCKVCEVLRLFHQLGWVHRDIGSGNILVVGDVVKISDLEWSKKLNDKDGKRPYDIRTGTEDFTSIEISGEEYAFEPKSNTSKTSGNATTDTRWMRKLTRRKPVAVARPGTPMAPTKRHMWFYNPLHDLESIYWLLLYFLGNKDIRCVPSSKASVEIEKTFTFRPESSSGRNRRIFYHYLFARTLFGDRSKREGLMLIDKRLPNHLRDFPLHPSISPLATPLLDIRDALVSRYREVEKNPATIDGACADGLHEAFSENIYAMMSHVQSTIQHITVHSLSKAVFNLPKSYLDQLAGDSDEDSIRSREDDYMLSARSKRSHADMGSDGEEDEDKGAPPAKITRPGSTDVLPRVSSPSAGRIGSPKSEVQLRRSNPSTVVAHRTEDHNRLSVRPKVASAPTRVLRSTTRNQNDSTASPVSSAATATTTREI